MKKGVWQVKGNYMRGIRGNEGSAVEEMSRGEVREMKVAELGK